MDSGFNWDHQTWLTLDSYFSQNRILVAHQLDSYNNFVDFIIPQIIEKNNPLEIATDYDERGHFFRQQLTIKFGQIYMSKPLIHELNDTIKPLYPNEARIRGLTYAAPMFIDVHYTLVHRNEKGIIKDTTVTKTESKIPFLKLPVMLHSKYCHLSDHNEKTLPDVGECEYDQGGYFIVNGGEKVLVSQERVADNQVFVWQPPKSTTSKYTHASEINASLDQRFYPVKIIKVKLTKEPSTKTISACKASGITCGRTLHVQMPYMREDIPLFIMFRALGVATEKEMFEMIIPNLETISSNYTNFLMASVDDARVKRVTTQETALAYLADRLNITFGSEFREQNKDVQIKYTIEVLNRELFPQIGQLVPDLGQNFRKKAFFLGHMTKKLIDCYFGVRPFDDRDHYGNKRVNLSGPLLTELFRSSFIKLIRDLRKKLLTLVGSSGTVDNIGPNIRKLIQGCNIDSKIKYGLSTGNWATQKGGSSASKKGIAQVLNRMSFAGALSHTRRIQSPLERAGSKIVPPRRLHGTHYGMCCPNETPEGQQIGIVKNLAMQTHVTIQTNDYPIRIILNKLGVRDLAETIASDVQYCTKIFVNGDWYGVIRDQTDNRDTVYELYHRLKTLKRHGVIVPYISIAWFIAWKEIHILTDGGRYSRPLYIVENDELLFEKLYKENATFRSQLIAGKVKWPHFLIGFHEGQEPAFDVKESNDTNGGVIEYLDTNEIENAMIAMTYADMASNSPSLSHYVRYSHCEIHPMMMMGVVSAMIPFSDHNQSPRNCYQCLWKEEKVLMVDGTMKPIKDIKVGEEVITVNPYNHQRSPSRVINQYVKTTNKPIITVTTISGRSLVCTNDHPILTNNGWKPSGQLSRTDLICICPSGPSGDWSLREFLQEEYRRTITHTNASMLYCDWCAMILVKTTGPSIFVPVESITPHDSVEIADITTQSESHSFITGQEICVHNSSMAKQSIGYYSTVYNMRMDTLAHVLVYGQKPLVTTRAGRYTLMDRLPHGSTAMLLYACFTGYNQEDSVILNKDAVDRGFFGTIFYRTYGDKAQKHRTVTTATERFGRPNVSKTKDKGKGLSRTYDKIDDQGRPKVGLHFDAGDVLIGKEIEIKGEESQIEDASTTVRNNEEGWVDMVIPSPENPMMAYNAEGSPFIKARVAVLRKPEIGDKFASRYSQKGTTGFKYKAEDLPFTAHGLVPDIMMNPHGIPSRMTIGKLLETMLGKIAVCTGKLQDATPFIDYDFEQFKQTLKAYGLDELGQEVMYNGQTGQMYDALFFYGPTYYQRLKHMVADKMHSRESGPVQLLTRQPAEGRSRDGGLRLGEMERDVLIAHGIPQFLKERMMDSSDLFKAYVSRKEETMIVGNPEKKIFKFNGQHIKDDEVVQIQLPYAMKLLLQELQSMGLDIRLKMA